MAGILTLTFTGVGVAYENIDVTGSGIILTFKPTRSTSKTVTIAGDAQTQAKEFIKAFVADYNQLGAYTVSQDGSDIILEHQDNDHFDNRTSSATNITEVLTTTVEVPTITVAESYTTNTNDLCNSVIMNLTFTVSGGGTVEGLRIARVFGNGFALETELYNDASHNSNTLTLAVNREDHFSTTARVTIGTSVTFYTLNAVKGILEIENVPITYGEYDATVKVNIKSFLGSTETTYAIASSGVTPVFQSSNVFTAIVAGEYFVFALDKYGCQKSQFITVDESNNTVTGGETFFSRKNSHYMADRTGTLANVDSALSYDDPYQVKVKEFKQIWSANQITTDQFKSSLPRHEGRLIVCEGGATLDLEFGLTIEQKSENINQDNYLEALVNEDTNENVARIRFVPGDVYDADGVVIGQHTYDDVVPPYYESGVKIRIENIEGEITEIRSVSGIEYAYTNLASLGSEQSFIVQSRHTEMDYEVYEYKISHTNLVDKTYQIEVKSYANKTTTTESKHFLSEPSIVISKDDLDAGSYHQIEFIKYEHDREIDYEERDYTDVKNKIPTKVDPIRITHIRNIPFYAPLDPVSSSEVTTEKLGNVEVKLDFLTREAYKTRFKHLPALFAASVAKSFDECDYVKIDGVLFTTLGSAELDGNIQYKTPSVTLVKAGGSSEALQTNKSVKEFYPVNRD